MNSLSNQIQFTPEKCKQIALARLDLIHKWLEFRKKSTNKLQADYDFVKLHNSSNSYLFTVLGKISRGSLHRWKASLDGTEDYTRLIPNYKYVSVNEYRTCLTDEEIKIFMGLLLHPNRICIGKAIALTKYKLKEQGQSFIPADITFRRYAKWFKDNNYDKWVLARDGEKALSDKVEPYIKRDASVLDVGDILVADGHKLAFQVINPFTGKPCRATLVGFLDWKSTALVGYEIMLEENTQCIASALRNAIINLDMVPKIVYQDNGRAFRAKYFTDDKGFGELGFYGLYAKLGIECTIKNIEKSEYKELGINAKTKESISSYMLELMKYSDKKILSKIRTNKTKQLSLREIIDFVIVNETNIISEESPIFSDNYEVTSKKSIFNFLLTNKDNSDLQEIEDPKITKAKLLAKIEVYNNLIKEASEKIEDLADFKIEDLNEQINSLECQYEYNIVLLNKKTRERSEYIKDVEKLKNLIIESSRLLNKYILLQEYYTNDIERIDFVEEGTFYLNQLNDYPCPIYDIEIDGKPRGHLGKGHRALTHAAFSVGLQNYMYNNDFSFPAFIILDSPLLSLKEADYDTEKLSNTIQDAFWKDLSSTNKDRQIIIFDNKEPNDDIKKIANYIKFTGNKNSGRCGFYE